MDKAALLVCSSHIRLRSRRALPVCSVDGLVLLWHCAADGSGLEPCTSFDVRAHLGAPAVRLLGLAASLDGQLLAAGEKQDGEEGRAPGLLAAHGCTCTPDS